MWVPESRTRLVFHVRQKQRGESPHSFVTVNTSVQCTRSRCLTTWLNSRAPVPSSLCGHLLHLKRVVLYTHLANALFHRQELKGRSQKRCCLHLYNKPSSFPKTLLYKQPKTRHSSC